MFNYQELEYIRDSLDVELSCLPETCKRYEILSKLKAKVASEIFFAQGRHYADKGFPLGGLD